MYTIEMIEGKRNGGSLPEQFCEENYEKVNEFHRGSETPLVKLEETAKICGAAAVYIKDESKRYGLNAFKALGAMYAVHNIVEKLEEGEKPMFVTATDGNHGKAVAWAASSCGCTSAVFMPAGTVPARSEAIASIEGASVFVTDLNYDDAVRKALEYSKEHDGIFVQDTGFEGYEDIPWDITIGYTRMISEAINQLGGIRPTHVFLQAGVGSMAGGITGYLTDRFGEECPVISVMEAVESACIFESVKQGRYMAIGGKPRTIMAGLNCGEANVLTLPMLENHVSFFFKVPDFVTEDGMRQLADEGVVAGECGGIGTGLLLNLTEEMKRRLGIDENSVILLFSTEGDTDPESYERIVNR